MKRIKAFAFFLLLSSLLLLGAGTALADQDSRIYDLAGLFSQEEAAALCAKAEALKNGMKMDVAIVTTEDNPGSAESFADDFYEENGMGTGDDYSGVLLLIDMENGELWISTEGKMLRYLTDGRIEAILDDIYGYAADGNFYKTADVFLDDVETCYGNGIASDQYNYDSETGRVSRYRSIRWYEFLFAFAAACVCGGAAVLAVVREYGMKDDANRIAANFRLSYRKDSAFRMGNGLADLLIGSYITRQLIASNRNHGGGGRTGGGRSLSSGGRTTTHRSSGGRIHGGGGRKFR